MQSHGHPAVLRSGLVLLTSALLAVPLLFLAGCGRTQPSPAPVATVQEISSEDAGDNFRLLAAGNWIYLTYPDLGALSLNLVRLGLPTPPGRSSQEPDRGPAGNSGGAGSHEPALLEVLETTYLDRITETPEIGEEFGIAPLVLRRGVLNVFYSDREREGAPVLKWVGGPTEENEWWIDILPYGGEPLAVLPGADDELDLYLLDAGVLYRQSIVSGNRRELLSPCDPAPDVCVIGEQNDGGITVFDRSSGRLYAFLRDRGNENPLAIYPAGAAHHALLQDGRLRVLIFSAEESTLLLLEEKPGGAPVSFTTTPVTLCEGTTSVHLGYTNGLPFFLYNERVVDQDNARRYLLSLLAPADGPNGEIRYRRADLLDSDRPLRRFRVSDFGARLYVFFVQDTLKILSVDLDTINSE